MTDAFEDHCWKDIVDPEILDIYSAYKRKTYIGSKPILLAIDLYNLVFEGGPLPVHEAVKTHPSSCGSFAWDAIQPIQDLLALVRSKNIPVIYTTNDIRKKTQNTAVHATHRKARKLSPRAYEIKAEFSPRPQDLIIRKERASAFFGTPLIAYLTRLGVDSVIVCGESTSGCVRASVVDAYSYGFHAVVVEECCFDRSLLSHKVNLFDLHHKYADVMHLQEVKAHLSETILN
ncbi:MAG: isochorismatase family protein [Desulfobacterales bacterium]|nr:isochorismatase family protein [Desulfobacterales bacterium]